MVGLDVSAAMLEQLRDKERPSRVHVAIADATRLPVAEDAAFGGAYCRWVLHLVAGWREAVRELCRVVAPGGVVVVEPGGYAGGWREVWLRFVDALGPAAEPVGLDARGGYTDLDEAFAACGAAKREVIETPMQLDSSLDRFLSEAAARTYSWTWRVGDAGARATVAARARVGGGAVRSRFSRNRSRRMRRSPGGSTTCAPERYPVPTPGTPGHGAARSPVVPITEVEKIWMDGELVDWPDAKIHVLSHALHYGTRCLRGHPGVRDRARPGRVAPGRAPATASSARAKLYHLDIPFSDEAIGEGMKDVIRANGLTVVLRPAARDPRLRGDGREPAHTRP